MFRALFILFRTLWTLPTTLVGLVPAILCTPFGTRWQVVGGVIEAHSGLLAWLLTHVSVLQGGINAITFGDIILGRSAAALDCCRTHEHVHVRQAHRWGPLFLPAYLLASLIALLRGRSAYRGNTFEIEAYGVSDGIAGRGASGPVKRGK